jgi:hypothetical protein
MEMPRWIRGWDGDVLSCGLALIGTGVFWKPV